MQFPFEGIDFETIDWALSVEKSEWLTTERDDDDDDVGIDLSHGRSRNRNEGFHRVPFFQSLEPLIIVSADTSREGLILLCSLAVFHLPPVSKVFLPFVCLLESVSSSSPAHGVVLLSLLVHVDERAIPSISGGTVPCS